MLDRVTAAVATRLPRWDDPRWRTVLFVNVAIAGLLCVAVSINIFVRDIEPGLGFAQLVLLPVLFAISTARMLAVRHGRNVDPRIPERDAV